MLIKFLQKGFHTITMDKGDAFWANFAIFSQTLLDVLVRKTLLRDVCISTLPHYLNFFENYRYSSAKEQFNLNIYTASGWQLLKIYTWVGVLFINMFRFSSRARGIAELPNQYYQVLLLLIWPRLFNQACFHRFWQLYESPLSPEWRI